MSGLDNDMELPQPPEPYKAMTEQPDWAVTLADKLFAAICDRKVFYMRYLHEELQTEIRAEFAAIIRTNFPDVGKLREALGECAKYIEHQKTQFHGQALTTTEHGHENWLWKLSKQIAAALASVPQPRGWISVNQQLPNNDSIILAFDGGSQMSTFRLNEFRHFHHQGVIHPTHWMYLPESPV